MAVFRVRTARISAIGMVVEPLMVQTADGRALPATRCACSLNETAPDIRRDVKVERANST
jgi:hypothetical protein